MGRKCCVTGCRSNYEEKITVFRLPSAKKNADERKRWIQAIPRDNIPDSKDTSVCVKHWPIMVYGKLRPKDPPSVFPNIPLSMLPTPPPKPRQTTKTLSEVRTKQEDELDTFLTNDRLTYDILMSDFSKRTFATPVISYFVNGFFVIQSCSFFTDSIPIFLIKMLPDLRFEAFHGGSRCYISSLSKNRITGFNRWSIIEEAIRYLHTLPMEKKKMVIKDQLEIMAPPKVGTKIYDEDTILRAFEYFSISRSCYQRIRTDYKLPSVKTLTKLTSKVNKLDDGKFLTNVFSNLESAQKNCIILVDEVYVKASLRYSGGEIFGKAYNNPTLLANTILGIMVKFLVKMIPVAGCRIFI